MTNLNRRIRFKSILFVLTIVMTFSGIQLFAAEPAPATGSFAKSFLPTWERAKDYSLEVAKLMPEEHYGYKPTPEISTFAGHLMHTVSSVSFFTGKLTGTAPQIKDNKEEGKTKAQVIELLTKAFDNAHKALEGLTDAEAAKKIHVFGELHLTKSQVVLLMRDHTTHHRGGLVIYLRLKGIKPPQFRGF